MTAERNIPLHTVVASYLAFIQLILDRNEAGIPWDLVRDNKTICMHEATLGKRFCTSCTQAPVEQVSGHGSLFRSHRARMSDQLLCDLVLAKYNSNHSCCHCQHNS